MYKHLLTFVMLFIAAFGTPAYILAQEEDPDVVTERLIPYTELDTPAVENPCYPLSTISTRSVLNFETTSMLYFKVDLPGLLLENGMLLVLKEGEAAVLEYPATLVGAHWRVELEPGYDFEILGKNNCDELTIVDKVSTKPRPVTALIEVSETVGEIASQWKMLEGEVDIYDHFENFPEVDIYEKYDFFQDFLKNGELIPDIYIDSDFIPRDDFMTTGAASGDCRCRVIKLTLTSEVYPTSSRSTNPNINPKVFPNSIIHQTNRVKFWHTGSFEGPARYQQIWGETARCRITEESAIWGDNSINSLSNALSRAAIRVEQICKTGSWTPGDCYCAQDVSFEYRYDAHLDARAALRSNLCFASRESQAIVDDVVMVMVGRRNNPLVPSTTVPIWHEMAAGGAVSSCNRDFQEKRILDIFKLGLSVYGYIKGIPIKIKDPLTSDVTNSIWQAYQKSLFFKSLENLITEPWIKGDCEQATETYGLHNSLNVSILGKDAIIFTLTAASHLEVIGKTSWDATGRVLSGFSTSVVLDKKDIPGPEYEYCCTQPGRYLPDVYLPSYSYGQYL